MYRTDILFSDAVGEADSRLLPQVNQSWGVELHVGMMLTPLKFQEHAECTPQLASVKPVIT
jgi:hypothetical protein